LTVTRFVYSHLC